MAALISSDFEIPAEISTGIFEKAQQGSALARLSGARPQKFGKQQAFVLTAPPKAELVGEAQQKSPTPTAYASKTVNPYKIQVTMRFSQEVMWADEDVQIGVLDDLASNAGIALGRALDLVGIHKINPLTGAVSSLVKEGIVDTTQVATLTGVKYDEVIEAAALVHDIGIHAAEEKFIRKSVLARISQTLQVCLRQYLIQYQPRMKSRPRLI